MDQETFDREEAEKLAQARDTDIKTRTAVIWIGGMLLFGVLFFGFAWYAFSKGWMN